MSTEADLKVSSQFRTSRHPGLTVLWEMGSNKLHLVRTGGQQGTYLIDTKTSASYRNAAGALAGATKWFKLLDKMFATTPATNTEVTRTDG